MTRGRPFGGRVFIRLLAGLVLLALPALAGAAEAESSPKKDACGAREWEPLHFISADRYSRECPSYIKQARRMLDAAAANAEGIEGAERVPLFTAKVWNVALSAQAADTKRTAELLNRIASASTKSSDASYAAAALPSTSNAARRINAVLMLHRIRVAYTFGGLVPQLMNEETFDDRGHHYSQLAGPEWRVSIGEMEFRAIQNMLAKETGFSDQELSIGPKGSYIK